MSAFWRRVRAIARNESIHILREPRTLLVALAQPVMLMLLYGYCISFDLTRIPFAVWDQDHGQAARQLVTRLDAGGENRTFLLEGYVRGAGEVEPLLAAGKARFVLVIPHGFSADLGSGRGASIQALFDGADSNTAGVASGYLTAALQNYNVRLAADLVPRRHGSEALGHTGPALGGNSASLAPLSLDWRVFYNPDLSSRRFIIPGLIAILLTFMAASLTSTTIVREREMGSLETVLTSPIGATDLVLGKMAPYILVAAGDVALVLLVGGFVFNIWPRGDLFTLGTFSLLFLLGNLAIGMLISSFAPNQQIALVLAILLNMLPNFFLTGFAFPRSNMPQFLQVVSAPLPATQYLVAIRGIFLKGVGWNVLWPQGLWMTLTAVGLVLLAIRIAGKRLLDGLE